MDIIILLNTPMAYIYQDMERGKEANAHISKN